MPESMTVRVCGVRWRVDLSVLTSHDALLAEHLRHLWARAAVEPDGTERDFAVLAGDSAAPRDRWGTPLGVRFNDPDRLPYELSRALTLASISARRGSALMLHAAALAAPVIAESADATPVLVLVGASGTGKSTAVRTLGPSFGYVTDETVVIEPDLSISPYPKPISLASQSRPGDKDEFSPDDAGLGVAPDALDVGAVVLLSRDPSMTKPDLRPIGLADAILGALPQTSSIQLLDRPLHHLARALTRGGGPYRLSYADIADCAELLADLLPAAHTRDCAGQAGLAPDVTWTGHPAEPSAGGVSPAPTGSVRRADYTDAIETDGEVIVLYENQPVRLAGIGATIWLESDTPQDLETLTARAVAAHGAHPDAAAMVRKATETLVDAKVLVRL